MSYRKDADNPTRHSRARLPKAAIGASIKPLRRLVSILLLVVFSLPLVSPLLARGQEAESSLPACCRRNGAHQCAMAESERRQMSAHDPQFRAPLERCPFCPPAVAAPHPNPLNALTGHVEQAMYAAIANHTRGAVQAECKRRISRDRSRQKRGPPANLLS